MHIPVCHFPRCQILGKSHVDWEGGFYTAVLPVPISCPRILYLFPLCFCFGSLQVQAANLQRMSDVLLFGNLLFLILSCVLLRHPLRSLEFRATGSSCIRPSHSRIPPLTGPLWGQYCKGTVLSEMQTPRLLQLPGSLFGHTP